MNDLYKFLTTKPLIRTHLNGCNDFVYILSLTQSLNDLNVVLVYHDETTSITTISLTVINKGNVFRYYLDYKTLQNIDPTKTIKRIEVYIEQQNKIVYNITEPKTSNVFTIIYKNSLGGFDSFQCEGDQVESLSSISITNQKTFPANYEYQFQEFTEVSQQSIDRLNLSSGYKNKKEIDSFKDAFHHKNVFHLYTQNNQKYLIPYRIVSNFSQTGIFSNLSAVTFTIEKSATNQYLQLP